jgi:CheY-like chemotaxis protein
MIVEKDSAIAGLWAELMASLGYEVCAIENGPRGAAIAARRENPDMMIVNGVLQLLASGLEARDFEVDLVDALQTAFGGFDRRPKKMVRAAASSGYAAHSLM